MATELFGKPCLDLVKSLPTPLPIPVSRSCPSSFAELATASKIDAKQLLYLGYAEYEKKRLTVFSRYWKRQFPKSTPKEICAEYEMSRKRDLQLIAEQRDSDGFKVRDFSIEKEWQLAETYGLLEGDLAALRYYQNQGYVAINDALAISNIRSPAMQRRIEAFRQALAKLPVYDESPLMRYGRLSPSEDDAHAVGKIVHRKTFTSATAGGMPAFETDYRFLIFGGKTPRDLRVLGGTMSHEQEVIFPENTYFKVLARRPNVGEKKTTDMILLEVDQNGNPLSQDYPKSAADLKKSLSKIPRLFDRSIPWIGKKRFDEILN